MKTVFGSSLPPVVCMMMRVYFPCLCLFGCGGVRHMLRCVFVFLRLLCPVLPVSLDCSFLIALPVFSNT